MSDRTVAWLSLLAGFIASLAAGIQWYALARGWIHPIWLGFIATAVVTVLAYKVLCDSIRLLVYDHSKS